MWTKKDAMEAAARGEGCLGKARDDEPVFILRGQDRGMAATVRQWAEHTLFLNGGQPNRKIDEAFAFANEIEEWQKRNPTKVPD